MEDTDWGAVRALFPACQLWTHLNSAAFGPVPSTAVAAMNRHFADVGESASLNFMSWFDRLDSIRAKIGRLIGADAADIGFCPNAGTALSWFLNGIQWSRGDEVVAIDHEFPNNLYAPLLLDRVNVKFRPLPGPDGPIDPDFILDALGPNTKLVLMSSVNYSNGLRAPLESLGPELRSRDVLFCVDATQSVGVLQHDLHATPVDFLFAHAYKWMLSPPGTGFFYAPKSTRERMAPTVVSWRSHKGWRNHEELHHGRPEPTEEAMRYEGGVQSFPLLFALEASIDLILECGPRAIESRALGLASECRDIFRSHGMSLLSPRESGSESAIVTASSPGRDVVELCRALEKKRIAVSARKGNLRASLHFFNNRDDLHRLSDALAA